MTPDSNYNNIPLCNTHEVYTVSEVRCQLMIKRTNFYIVLKRVNEQKRFTVSFKEIYINMMFEIYINTILNSYIKLHVAKHCNLIEQRYTALHTSCNKQHSLQTKRKSFTS